MITNLEPFNTGDCRGELRTGKKANKMIADVVRAWIIEHEMFSGEAAFQSDTFFEKGPEMLAELIDYVVFSYEVDWEHDGQPDEAKEWEDFEGPSEDTWPHPI